MLMRKRSTSNRKALLNMATIKPFSYFNSSQSHHSLTSPTSPLDFKPLLNFFTSSSSSSIQVQHHNHKIWEDYSNKVGLSIIHSLHNDDDYANHHSKVLQSKRIIIRDSAHHIQSSKPSSSSLPENLNVLRFSEIQLSEDYTCVTRYGPNPKVTHIFNDCILQSHENTIFQFPKIHPLLSYPPNDFLSFCYMKMMSCRGEKAFCSCHCRSQEISIEEEKEEALEINANNSPADNSDKKLSDIQEINKPTMFIAPLLLS